VASPGATITVTSSSGGSDTENVRYIWINKTILIYVILKLFPNDKIFNDKELIRSKRDSAIRFIETFK